MKAQSIARKAGLLVLFVLFAALLAQPTALQAESDTTAGIGYFSSSLQETQTQATQSQPIIPHSVQERIRLRKQQRLDQQIEENYSHKFEAYAGMGYLRFHPGVNLQKINEKEWVLSLSRWYSQKWGVSVEGRGSYGTAYTGPNGAFFGNFLPKVFEYTELIGGNYRFYRRPKIGATFRLAGGLTTGSFDGNSRGITSTAYNAHGVGIYKSATSFALNAAVPVDFTVVPSVAIRVTPEYLLTPFDVTSSFTGSKGTALQNNFGFNIGVVYRFLKR